MKKSFIEENCFKLFVGVVIVLASLTLFTCESFAQESIQAQMRISWTNPSEACGLVNNVEVCEPITQDDPLTAINIWVSDAPIPDDFSGAPTIVVTPDASPVIHTVSVQYGQVKYIRAKAIMGTTRASVFSDEVSKTFNAKGLGIELIPGAPASVTVDVNIPLP